MTSSHYDPTIVSPRPHRTDNPAADLDSLAPPPAYSMPAPFAPMSAPAAGPGSDWSPWAFAAPPRSPFPNPPPAPPTPAAPMQASHRPSSTTSTSLTATLPSIPTLLEAAPSITSPSIDGSLKITWARDVFFLADRAHHLHLALTTPVGTPIPSVSDPITGPMPLSALDPSIVTLINTAVPLVLSIASPFPHGQPYNQSTTTTTTMQTFEAEAIYMRAVLASTGAFPHHLPFNPKAAFRDFETAARGGYAGAWYRLARDYEAFGDLKHAKDCFERGAKLGVESCLYRLGMAQLLGQLTFTADIPKALPILHRAAVLASLECPQPAYVYSLLLLSEFSSIPPIPPSTFASLSSIPSYPPPPSHPSQPLTPLIPLGSSPHLESRHHLERAAYLHYGPAQYKLGHAYEFADPPFYFDPLLSVQYYSLASQNGEVEADMALSKWFLCGSTGSSTASAREAAKGGGFDKDESLALTFAQKASSRNLTSAHFAMGYYAEVGVGRPPSIPDAIHYYTLAAQAGNTDAAQRLEVLSASDTNAESNRLSKGVHEQRVERTRTMAQRRTEETPISPPFQGQTFPSLAEAQKVAMSAGAAQPGFQNLPLPGGNAPPTSTFASLSLSNNPQRPAAAQRDPRAVVELVRKSTMSTYLPLNASTISAGASAQAPPLPRPPQQVQTPAAAYAAQHTQVVGSGRMPHNSSSNSNASTPTHPSFGPRPPSAGPRPPSAGPPRPPSAGRNANTNSSNSRPQSSYPVNGGGGAYGSPRPQSSYPVPPHSAAPAGYGGTPTSSSRPASQVPGTPGSYNSGAPGTPGSQAGGYGSGGGGGGQGGGGPGTPGGYGSGGQGGRPRPQSPARRPSPGPGRMGKLRVGVEDHGSVPPVPGTGAPPNTAQPPSTANPNTAHANINTPGLTAPNTSLAGHTPRPTGKHPATFAEMGIQGAKAEDKDCVVM